MISIMFHRFLRYFRENLVKYLAMLILIASVVVVIVALEGTAYTIIEGRENNKSYEQIEDGQFSTLIEVPEAELNRLEEEYDAKIEDISSIDIDSNGVCYRVFKVRNSIDRLVLYKGEEPKSKKDIVVDQVFAKDNDISIGDSIKLRKKTYTICGIGAIADYERPTKNSSSVGITTKTFSWAMVSEKEYDRIMSKKKDGEDVLYTYSYIIDDKIDVCDFSDAVHNLGKSEKDTEDKDFYNLVKILLSNDNDDNSSVVLSFTVREDNNRMDEDVDYAELYRTAGYFVGAMLIAMLAFIFAIFIKNQVHNDHLVIGSLYAMGVKKRTIMVFYLLPGFIISVAGGLLGLIVGFYPEVRDIALNAFHNTNSFPYYEFITPIEVYLYAMAMPPLMNLIVSFLVLNRSLSKPVLSIIRDEENRKIRKRKLRIKGFIPNFQMSRLIEDKSFLIVALCVFFSITLFFLGFTTSVLVTNNQGIAKENTKYENLCLIKNAGEELETEGDKIYLKEVKTEKYSGNVAFSIIGIEEDCESYDVKTALGNRNVVIGEALATKLKLKVGDSLTFHEGISEEEKTVVVWKIVDSNASLELYMDIDAMRRMYAVSDSYYNAVAFPDGVEIDIDDEKIYSTIKKDELIDSFDTMMDAMKAFIRLSYTSSILIFIMTLYLIVSTLIDKNKSGISLVRVFGFRKWEIQRMFVNNVIVEVIIALLIAIPLGKVACNMICPYVYDNLAMGMFFNIPIEGYIKIFAASLGFFILILLALIKKVNGISTEEILKVRE